MGKVEATLIDGPNSTEHWTSDLIFADEFDLGWISGAAPKTT
jgi:hypothetical protein